MKSLGARWGEADADGFDEVLQEEKGVEKVNDFGRLDKLDINVFCHPSVEARRLPKAIVFRADLWSSTF